jgi:hypothetical protein
LRGQFADGAAEEHVHHPAECLFRLVRAYHESRS